MSETIEQILIRHEGLKLKPYRCPAGKLTIGVGRNLEDKGISEVEAVEMLRHDLNGCTRQVLANYPWSAELSQARFDVLVMMCFNLGLAGLAKFKKMLAAMKLGNYDEAAAQALDSQWVKQVGKRAVELAEMIRRG